MSSVAVSTAARDANSLDVREARRVYARLLRYAKPYWRLYLIGLIGTAMFATADLLTVWFVKTFMQDALALAQHPVLFAWLPLAVIGIFLVRGLGDYLANYFPARAGRYVIKAVRGQLFDHYLHLPTAQYDRESSALMLSRLTYNAELVASAATDSLVTIVRDSLTIAGNIAVVFYLNWRLALCAIVVAPANRLAGAQPQYPLSPLRHAHPELHR